ncbi:MAG: response regulator [Treponema sp.]|nr:response regulator [Treponema sp.]
MKSSESIRSKISSIPLEYIIIIAVFFLLITSVGFLIIENWEMVQIERKNTVLYESVLSIDTTLIQAVHTASMARRFVRTQSTQDLENYRTSYNEAIQLVNNVKYVLNQNISINISKEIKDVLLNIVQEITKNLETLDSLVMTIPVLPHSNNTYQRYDTISDNEINKLIDQIDSIHENKLAMIEKMRNERSAQINRALKRVNLAAITGIFISVIFYIVSFFMIRNKISTILRYSKKLEQEAARAQQAERVKSEFLANMSHEIRTPMTAILGFSELLSDGIEDPRYKSYLKGIQTSGKALLDLINDILDLSKIEAGRMTIKPAEIDLPSFITSLEFIFSEMAKKKGLDFSKQIGASVPNLIMADETRLRQILINLLGNAIKFTNHGFVKLSVNLRNEKNDKQPLLLFSVIDSGIGISKAHQSLIFDAFRQVDGKTTRNYGGTGLGLSISLQLARLMGGTIVVQSEEMQGSTFTLELPLTIPKNSQQNVVCEDEGTVSERMNYIFHLTGGTVLIVEDELYNRTILREFLGKEQVHILTADNGEDALKILEHEKVDVVVTDIMMPKMSGTELIKRIKESKKLSSIPIIIASASTPLEDYQNLSEVAGILKKPFKRTDFISLLARFLPHEKINCIDDKNSKEISEETNEKDWWKSIDPSIRATLKETYEKKFKILKITLSITEIAKFGKDIFNTGNNLHIESLCSYGKALSEAADNLDISAINTLLAQFEQMIAINRGC